MTGGSVPATGRASGSPPDSNADQIHSGRTGCPSPPKHTTAARMEAAASASGVRMICQR